MHDRTLGAWTTIRCVRGATTHDANGQSHCRPDALAEYDEAMVQEGVIPTEHQEGEGAQTFLRLVVLRLLNDEQASKITRSEVYKLQVGRP